MFIVKYNFLTKNYFSICFWYGYHEIRILFGLIKNIYNMLFNFFLGQIKVNNINFCEIILIDLTK